MKNKIILTIDVEDWFMVQNMEGVISRQDWVNLEDRINIGMNFLLDELSKRRIKATFFILGCVAEKNPGLVKRIFEEGHEVASHGYSHSAITKMTKEEFKNDLEKGIKALEQILPSKIKGYRAPSFSIVKDTLWALETMADLGLTYDSSIYPVSHPNYGIADFGHDPQKIGKIIEIPMVPLKFLGFNLPVGGGGYFRLFPYSFTQWALKRMLKKRCVPVYFHPWEFDPTQPKINIGFLNKFRHYVGLGSNRKKLIKLLDQFEFITMESYLKHISKNLML